MPGASVKLLLADDPKVVCKAIRFLLSQEPSIEVLGEAHPFQQIIEMASLLQPNVILLDLRMPERQGFERSTVKALLTHSERIIAMSIWNDDGAKALAQEYGAVALLDKVQLGFELIPALREGLAGGF
jgi:DNA-binding NarL/FixJ family response regulator